MKHIIGHNKIVDFFSKVAETGNISHAYIFSGPDRIGKKHVAMELAMQLLGTDRLSAHADYRYVAQGVDSKTGKTKKNISISQMREIRHFLRGKPFVAKRKVVIIDTAHLMTSAASNALLKSLEEPSGFTTIFLISSHPTVLPQTILSRCQHIYLSPIAEKELIEGLLQEGVPESLASKIAKITDGRVGLSLDFARHPEQLEAYEQEIDRFLSLFGQPFYKKNRIVEDLYSKKNDHIAGRSHVEEALGVWQMAIHQKNKEGLEWTEDPVSIYNAIQEAKEDITKNIHPRLLVEHVLLSIP